LDVPGFPETCNAEIDDPDADVAQIIINQTKTTIEKTLPVSVEVKASLLDIKCVEIRRIVRRMLQTQTLVVRIKIELITTDPAIAIDTGDIQQGVSEAVSATAFAAELYSKFDDVTIGIITSTVTNATSPNSDAPSNAPTSGATLASTQECTEYCAQSGVTEICGGAVTGSFCALEDASGNAIEDKCYKRPRCTCICQGGDLYYDVTDRFDVFYNKEVCGKNPHPDCEDSDPFSDDVCFSPIATVMVNGKGRVMMKDLANGDDVLTMDGSYQTMYSMNHYHTSKETTFVQIKTNLELEQPLELSPKHLLYLVDNTNPVPASTIEVGDNVWTLKGRKEVLEVNMITRGGLYNPLTTDGTIVVDGVAASVYTTPSGKAHLQMEGVWSKMTNSLSFHDALHMISAPYRQYCTMVSIDLCNLHEKESAASSFMKTFFFSFFSNQNGFVKFIVASSYVLVFGTLANLTYFKVWFLLANAFAFFTILSKMTRTKKAAF